MPVGGATNQTVPSRSSSLRTWELFWLDLWSLLVWLLGGPYSHSKPYFWQDSHLGRRLSHLSFRFRQNAQAIRPEELVATLPESAISRAVYNTEIYESDHIYSPASLVSTWSLMLLVVREARDPC